MLTKKDTEDLVVQLLRTADVLNKNGIRASAFFQDFADELKREESVAIAKVAQVRKAEVESEKAGVQ